MAVATDKTGRAERVAAALKERYPDAICSLESDDPFQLLVSVRLSAQCTDERVNLVTPALFKKFPDIPAFASADIDELEKMIFSCGFYRSKARDLKAAAQYLLENCGGVIPDSMDELLKIPGVGRKSANLLLGDIYGQPAVVCDTHCIRICNRLGLCDSTDPYKVEMALREVLDPVGSNDFCHRIVLFGREICQSRAPKCELCPIRNECEFPNKESI